MIAVLANKFSPLKVAALSVMLILVWPISSFSQQPETRDVTTFANDLFRERVNAVIKSLYCKALSCELVIERVRSTKLAEQTYLISGGGYLRWTIPGVGTSAKRTLDLSATYTRGTCVVKEVKTISDVSDNNNGWGASRLQNALAGIKVPNNVILEADDCAKVDQIIWQVG